MYLTDSVANFISLIENLELTIIRCSFQGALAQLVDATMALLR